MRSMGRKDWIPARAEPLWHRAYTIVSGEGLDDDFAAGLDVQWRVHIQGRDTYEFEEKGRRVPFWVMKGSGHGRHWYTLRRRATHGLLREVGVPCRVHPEKPYKIDIDWSRAYDEHQPAWDRKDHRAKAYTQRAEGPLGKLLAPIEFMGLRKLSPEEQAEVDREVEERIERENRLPPEQQAEVDEVEWIAAQGRQAKRLFKAGRRASATVTALSAPPPGSLVWTIALEVEGLGHVEHRQAMTESWAAQLPPGAQTSVAYDPADPAQLTLA
jgi:hypothetical protein